MRKARKILHSFYKAADNTIMHDGVEFAGYLAFLSLLSLFPFLVFLVAIIGQLSTFDSSLESINQILATLPPQVLDRLPPRVAETLQPRIHEILSGPPQGLLTVAIVGAIWTASSIIEGMRTVLNRAYGVHNPPAYLWRRLLSILQFLIISAAIVLGMFLLVFWPVIMQYIEQVFEVGESQPSLDYVRLSASAMLLFFVVSSLYYFIPNIRQSWFAVAPGSAIVVGMWMGAATLFSMYLKNFDQVNLIYGSLGGFIASLLFFYIIALIFIFGAELNYLLEKALGYEMEEKEHAEEE